MATTSTAQTHWEGGLKEGSGQVELVTSGAGTFDVNWAKRADAGKGTDQPRGVARRRARDVLLNGPVPRIGQ